MKWLGRWFWSPIKAGENAAQTIVRVLGNLFRSTLTLVVFGFAALLGLSEYNSQQWKANLDAAKAEEAKIEVLAGFADDESVGKICEEGYPLIVQLTNKSSKALMSATVELTAREEGSSTNKLGYVDSQLNWDVIVPPQHRYYQCWSVKAEHRRLKYSGELVSYSLRLEPVEDWMLQETKAFKIEPK